MQVAQAEVATEGWARARAGLRGAPGCVSRAVGSLPGEGCAQMGPWVTPGACVLYLGFTWAFLPHCPSHPQKPALLGLRGWSLSATVLPDDAGRTVTELDGDRNACSSRISPSLLPGDTSTELTLKGSAIVLCAT